MNQDKLQRIDNPEVVGKRKRRFIKILVIIILLILLCLCFRSCRARDEPLTTQNRIYEEDCTPEYEDVIPSEENKRPLAMTEIIVFSFSMSSLQNPTLKN